MLFCTRYFLITFLTHWCLHYLNVYHVHKWMNCYKFTVIISRRAHFFLTVLYMTAFIYIIYTSIQAYLFLFIYFDNFYLFDYWVFYSIFVHCFLFHLSRLAAYCTIFCFFIFLFYANVFIPIMILFVKLCLHVSSCFLFVCFLCLAFFCFIYLLLLFKS